MGKIVYRPGYSADDIMFCTNCKDTHGDADRVEGVQVENGDAPLLCPKCKHPEVIRYSESVWDKIKSL